MDLKTIGCWTRRPKTVVELIECDLVYNDGLRVEADATEVAKAVLGGCRWNGEFFGCRTGRNEPFG